ncbi:MAG: hypothetical protein ABI580_12475, partial [Burkholderiaceae bacterium]
MILALNAARTGGSIRPGNQISLQVPPLTEVIDETRRGMAQPIPGLLQIHDAVRAKGLHVGVRRIGKVVV